MPLPLLAAGLGIIGGLGKIIGRGRANKNMSKLLKDDPTYTANPLAANRLGLAQSLLNARMPGAASAERNIYGSQAAGFNNAARSATDPTQLLAAGVAGQAQTDQSFENLEQQEAAGFQQRYNNLTSAQEEQIQEDDKVFNDQTRRFNDKFQVAGAKNANNQNSWGDISNLGFGLADFGMAEGFEKLMKKRMAVAGNPNNQNGFVGGGPTTWRQY